MTNSSTDDIEQYTWQGDTWFVVDGECPECKNSLTGNGKIKSCPNCNWWKPLGEIE